MQVKGIAERYKNVFETYFDSQLLCHSIPNRHI